MLALVSNMAVARLLTPGEVGIYAIAAVLAGIAQLFRDMGIGQYLIREPVLEHGQLRTAFTLMALISWMLGLSLFLLAGPVAAFYAEPDLTSVLRIQSCAFVIIPFGAISLTLLKREFRFGATYAINSAAHIVQLIVTISLAATGWGAQSLAFGSVAGILITAVGAVGARRRQFMFLPSLAGAKRIFRFGATVTGAEVLVALNRDLPELIIGKFMGTPALAFFSKALLPSTMFSRFVMGALNPVMLPALSQKHRENGAAGPMLHATACLTAISLPSLILVAFLADSVVMILFGDQWAPAVEPLRILALATALASMTSFVSPLMVAMGHPRALLEIQAIVVPFRITLVSAAVTHSLELVAVGWLVSNMLSCWLMFRKAKQVVGLHARCIWGAVRTTVTIGGPLAVAIGFGIQAMPVPAGVWAAIITTISAFALLGLIWTAVLISLRHPMAVELGRAVPALGRMRRRV